MEWTTLKYLEAGAYIAIMIAVLGVSQMISSYFDLKARRMDRLENEANAERRHRETLEERREERRWEEERRREERAQEEERRRHEEERRREERVQEEERRRQEEERRREERAQEEERRRQEEERRRDDERRHQELIALIVAAMNNGRNQNDTQNELIRALQQTVADLQAENARLRQQNGNADA